MDKVYLCIDKLISYACNNLGLKEKDVDYARNAIFNIFGLNSYIVENNICVEDTTPEKVLYEFNDACIEAGLYEYYESEYYLDQVMGFLTMLPSSVEEKFNEIVINKDSKSATEWFYDYSVKSDYVKKAKLDKNPRFDSNGLVITINKAKPEFRDPKKAQSGNSVKGGYPKCTICHANEGFGGRSKKTLRTIDLSLNGEKWFWQFSPYGYFYQHGIVVNYNHTPMRVDKDTFPKLMDFVDIFPHWFIGSNAALPRIGGSVLAHDHYQGGGEILPMHKAKAKYTLKNKEYPNSLVEIVDWPGTVVRVVSFDRKEIIEISTKITNKWNSYDNNELCIISKDDDGIHSAVSPTVVKTNRGYEMSIIFRNNLTNDEFPDGIFHAHPEFHIIKKESIGLIEAQGLFILPGRLENELEQIKQLIVERKVLTDELKDFQMVYDEIVELCNNDFSSENVSISIQKELGSICYRILENTAVFKDDNLTIKFMEELDFYGN